MKKIILIGLLSLPLAACQPGAGEDTAKTLSQAQSTSALGSLGATTSSTTNSGGFVGLAALTPSLGVKNFDQINQTMATATGIAVNTQINTKYVALSGQLPPDNDAKGYTFSAQGAATELAAEYCSVLLNNATYVTQRNAAFGTMINFTAIPTVTLTPAVKMDVAQKIIAKFWGDGLPNMSAAALAANQQILVDLMTDLAAGEANTANTTKNVALGACTAALSSAQVIMM